MGKITSDKKLKSWSEINKSKKDEKRKWKEQNLQKKLEKQKAKQLESESKPPPPPRVTNPLSTISIAVPGSILENAQSPELRTYLAGQIARAACIFCVDEIVVFDDYCDEATARKAQIEDTFGLRSARECCVQLGRILQYLECPQYLRRHFFPIHKHLKYCGVLNPLNAPHHLGINDESEFREGVVTDARVKEGRGSVVDVGLHQKVNVDKSVTPGVRCTVQLLPPAQNNSKKKLKGVIVAPSTPRDASGTYWGYKIRLATTLSAVFSQCPYKDGYDLTIGTSDKGDSVDEFSCPEFQHLLVVFGGLNGLEVALETDPVLNVDDPRLLFDSYLNTLPLQGSKTIRTEEAILVTLGALRPKLNPRNKPAVDAVTKGSNSGAGESVKIE